MRRTGARKQGVKYECFFIIPSVYTKIHRTACCKELKSFRNRNMRRGELKSSFVHSTVCYFVRTYLHWCAFNRPQAFVFHKPFDSTVSFAHELQEWVSIVVPKLWQFSAGRELAAGQFQSDFHASVPNVVVILHSTCQGVPSCSIGRSITELRSSNLKHFNIECPKNF